MTKIVKFNQGDILYNSFTDCKVELLRRWDRKPNQRTSWLVRLYPNGEEEFAAAEDELYLDKP